MSLKAYKWFLLTMCVVVLALILVLPKFSNTKAGNYTADGIFVRAASGQPYLVMETEEDPLYIVRLDDGTEDGTLFDNFAHGGRINVRTGGVIHEDEIASHALVVADLSRKKDNKPQEVPAEILAEVERIDALYARSEASA